MNQQQLTCSVVMLIEAMAFFYCIEPLFWEIGVEIDLRYLFLLLPKYFGDSLTRFAKIYSRISFGSSFVLCMIWWSIVVFLLFLFLFLFFLHIVVFCIIELFCIYRFDSKLFSGSWKFFLSFFLIVVKILLNNYLMYI